MAITHPHSSRFAARESAWDSSTRTGAAANERMPKGMRTYFADVPVTGLGRQPRVPPRFRNLP